MKNKKVKGIVNNIENNIVNNIYVKKCPAKINISLKIKEFDTEKKKHYLKSSMQKISLCDRMEIRITQRKKIQITMGGKYKNGIPNNAQNIVYKAAEKFFQKYGFSFGVEICIEKNIPNGAGLGGGSSNAAEILQFLHAQKNIPLIPSEYVDLGSDIPFFLDDFSCGKVEGIGEKISRCSRDTEEKEKFGALIFPHKIKISTAWAFTQFSKAKKSHRFVSLEKNPNKNFGIPENDFTPLISSFFPEIGVLLQKIKNFPEVKRFGMSGSGSTIFALFTAKKDQENFLENFPDPNNTNTHDEIIGFECV